jgi:hypothetical protein
MRPSVRQRVWQSLISHKKKITQAVWILVTLIAIAAIAYRLAQDWQEIQTYPWHLKWSSVLRAFGIFSVSILLTFSVWLLIVRRLAAAQSLATHARLFFVTNLARRLPTLIPYLGARMEAYASHGLPREITLSALTLEMVTTVIGATLVAFITLPFGPFSATLQQFPLPTLFLLIIPILLILFPNWFFAAMNVVLVRLERPALDVKVSRRDMLVWAVLFAAVWANGGVLYYYLAKSIYPMPSQALLVVMNAFAISGVAAWMGQFLFFMPTLALRQLMLAYLLSLGEIPFSAAVAVALVGRLCVTVFELVWALLSLGLSRLDPKVS